MDKEIVKEYLKKHQEGQESANEYLDKIVDEEPFKLTQAFDAIVQKCKANELSVDALLHRANRLAEWIFTSSALNQKKFAEAASSDCSLLSKILLLRELKTPFTESTFSPEVVLSHRSPNKNKCKVFNKTQLQRPLAYGKNLNGRLGVGSEEDLLDFVPIRLPDSDDQIVEIHMSPNHTIFLLENGSFYGAGKAENFMTDGTTGAITVPVKLDYIEKSPSKVFQGPFCEVTENSTTFFYYKNDTKLVIGQRCNYDVAKTGGQNWELQQCEPNECPRKKPMKVELNSVLYGCPKVYTVRRGIFYMPDWDADRSEQIVFIICGKSVPVASMFQVSHRENGMVYVSNNGTLYSGKLQTAPRGREETIVVFLKEVVIPFYVEGFFVNESGDSFVFYPSYSQRNPHVNTEPQMRTIRQIPLTMPYSIVPKSQEPITYLGSELRALFSEYLEELPENLAERIYGVDDLSLVTGLPQKAFQLIQSLHALQDFLHIDKTGKVPTVLAKMEKSTDFYNDLDKEFNDSLFDGRSIRPLVLTSGGNDEERRLEITTKARSFLDQLHAIISNGLDVLVNLPLRYRRRCREDNYALLVHNLICDIKKHLEQVNDEYPRREIHKMLMEFQPDIRKLVEERVKEGAIDPEDPDMKVLKVEAIPVDYYTDSDDEVTEIKSYYFETTSTVFFIKLIDESLLKHVDNGVLNLNVACQYNLKQFPDLLRAFFDYPTTYEGFMNHWKHANVGHQKICEKFPCLEVDAKDGQISIPPSLVNLYMNSEKLEEVSKNFSSEAFKSLTEILFDTAEFFRLDKELKQEVFQLSQELQIKHIKRYLLQMIVLTATESDFEFIKSLFDQFPDDMIEFVARYRSDIVLHWQNLPFQMHKLDILSRIADKMGQYCFSTRNALPLPLSPDEVNLELINEQWLTDKLSRNGENYDVETMRFEFEMHRIFRSLVPVEPEIQIVISRIPKLRIDQPKGMQLWRPFHDE